MLQDVEKAAHKGLYMEFQNTAVLPLISALALLGVPEAKMTPVLDALGPICNDYVATRLNQVREGVLKDAICDLEKAIKLHIDNHES